MRFQPPSVRARLTLWHAGVLTLIVCVFSAGILLLSGLASTPGWTRNSAERSRPSVRSIARNRTN
jgi:hypothetical protein